MAGEWSWIVAPRGRLLHLLRPAGKALSGRRDTPLCKHLAFLVGFDTGRRAEAARAFRDHQLKGWCGGCLKEATKSRYHDETADDDADDDVEDDEGASGANENGTESLDSGATERAGSDDGKEWDGAVLSFKCRSGPPQQGIRWHIEHPCPSTETTKDNGGYDWGKQVLQICPFCFFLLPFFLSMGLFSAAL